MSLKLKFFLFNIFSITLAASIVAFIGWKMLSSTLMVGSMDRLNLIRTTKTAAIENYFKDVYTAAEAISQHRLIDDLVDSPQTVLIENPNLFNQLDSYALDFNIYDFVIIDIKGNVAYSYRQDLIEGDSIYNKQLLEHERLQTIFDSTQKSDEGDIIHFNFTQDVYDPSQHVSYISTSVYRQNRKIGLLILKVNILDIDNISNKNANWSSYFFESTGESLLYSSKGELLTKTRFQPTRSVTPDFSEVHSQGESVRSSFDYRDVPVYQSIGKVFLPNGQFWYVVSKVDKKEATYILRRIAWFSGTFIIVTFLIFFASTFFITSRILKPINSLSASLENLDPGNFQQKLTYRGKDEIAQLVSRYNNLLERLNSTTVSKEHLDTVIQSIASFLFLAKVNPGQYDPEFTVIQSNEVAQKFLNQNKTDLKKIIKTNVSMFYDYRWLLTHKTNIEAELNNNGYRIPVMINWSPIEMRTGQEFLFVFVCTDMTEKIAEKTELIAARETAVRASAAKSEFLARMSHEIRTPLNAIIGVTDTLGDSELTKEQKELLDIATNAGENLLALVNDILDISKIEAREVKIESIPFDIIKICRSVIEILTPKALEKNLEIRFAPPPADKHFILGDPTRVRQVLLNLLGNSIKFTNSGHVELVIESLKNSKFLTFKVIDTGTGIPEDKHDVLFEKFVQADSSITRKYGGSGLGLPISKNLIELMGGKIWFESTEGVGTTFYFTLPNFETAPESHQTPEEAPKANLFSSRMSEILIVDDTEDNRYLLANYLKKYPFVVTHAQNGLDALEKVTQKDFDVILMDIQMPIMDGYEATKRIREMEKEQNKKEVPIIAVSANAMADDIQHSLRVGCTEHLTKPLKKATLIKALTHYIN